MLTCSILSANTKNIDTGKQERYQDSECKHVGVNAVTTWNRYAIDSYHGIVIWSKKVSSFSLRYTPGNAVVTFHEFSHLIFITVYRADVIFQNLTGEGMEIERLSNLMKVTQFIRRRYFKRGSAADLCPARERGLVSLKKLSDTGGIYVLSLDKTFDEFGIIWGHALGPQVLLLQS